MTERSSYEAAAFYDYVNSLRDTPLPAAALVVDLDLCALGICRYGAGGTVELLAQEEQPGTRAAVLERLPQEGRAALLTEIRKNMLRFYRTGGKWDGPACVLPETGPVLCSRLDGEFAADAQRLGALLEHGLERLAGLQISEENIRVLAIGELAAYYPAEFILRKRLSPAPFLPDSRFAAPADPPGEIVRLGRELYQKQAGHDVILICLNSDGQREELVLAAKDRPAPEQPVYCAPVFAAAGESLLLRVDGEERALHIPFMPGAEGELVELACRGDRGALLFRRTRTPEQIYEQSIEHREDGPL